MIGDIHGPKVPKRQQILIFHFMIICNSIVSDKIHNFVRWHCSTTTTMVRETSEICGFCVQIYFHLRTTQAFLVHIPFEIEFIYFVFQRVSLSWEMLHMSWNSEEKKFNETKSNKLLNLKMWEISFSIDWSDQIKQ